MIGFIVWTINQLINLYIWAIIIWCLLSWFPGARSSSLGGLLDRLVRPYMDFFDFIPPLGGVSFSPVVAIGVLYLVQYGVRALGAVLHQF
ncbi:MAG: YggT family protein [[Lactobacillus] timonensis]|uniref:YggT family protein n=1 Tax=[Lactobacillus] timonensis TaxID=1970790 RepID=UPI0015E0E179|nr:YggT family protein [[Lactobacillus] timonensis]MCI1287475.1 YggT family protein [[Lactobacillus] timonensis]MCI1926155.1 YggT family protein [[Lactobacillus] timonensis]MCI1957515.1 YggT family protein [[Lactobacillus] timonensis]MCI1970575.1 YggT family protein [[Lactobacillus] timonensis]MCI2006709.1 YggT family protein [[Lactobacillus] timonensis]